MTDKESMKLALDALETLMIEHGSIYEKAIAALKERLAQPEQEPVAWMYVNTDGECEQIEYGEPFDDPSTTPLYTHPPQRTEPAQRTWVGLNDDEIDYLIYLAYTDDEEFVRTIEAKLKEKNLPCIKPEWIGLTEKEHTEIAIECGCMSADWVFYGAAVERKVKERNT
jgi:hypothetical protein